MHHCKNNGRNFDSLSPEHLTGCTLWLKKRVFNPAASSNIALRLKINIFNPKYSLHTPFQGLSGIKIYHFDPKRASRWPRGLIFGIPEPKCLFRTPFQGLSGIKSRLSEPTAPSRCRLLGLQVRSRSAQHSVLSRSAASRCLSSPSAPLVPPQGPAAPSLAAPHPPSGGRGAKAGLACEMASRSAGVWGGSPSLDSCPDLRTLRLAHRESFASAEPGTSSAIRRPRSESRV